MGILRLVGLDRSQRAGLQGKVMGGWMGGKRTYVEDTGTP